MAEFSGVTIRLITAAVAEAAAAFDAANLQLFEASVEAAACDRCTIRALTIRTVCCRPETGYTVAYQLCDECLRAIMIRAATQALHKQAAESLAADTVLAPLRRIVSAGSVP